MTIPIEAIDELLEELKSLILASLWPEDEDEEVTEEDQLPAAEDK